MFQGQVLPSLQSSIVSAMSNKTVAMAINTRLSFISHHSPFFLQFNLMDFAEFYGNGSRCQNQQDSAARSGLMRILRQAFKLPLPKSIIGGCMTAKIEVYIRNEVGLMSQGIMRPVVDHWCSDAPTGKYVKIIREEDRAVLAAVEEFAKEKGLQIEVCDVATFAGKLKAKLKGVRKTPTILIGKQRFEGELGTEQLKNQLEASLRQ